MLAVACRVRFVHWSALLAQVRVGVSGADWERFQQQRRDGLIEFAAVLTRKTTRVRYDQRTITDSLSMLTADADLRLVRDAGWPVER